MTSRKRSRLSTAPVGPAGEGLVLLSAGFRPFFLGAAIWGVVAMALWVVEVTAGLGLGGAAGGSTWHAHEMLFGYTCAALAGFLLTAIPNWTGRRPVSGWPLLGLFSLWVAGRLAVLWPNALGEPVTILVEASFLPMLSIVCAHEIVAGKKWKDLKVLGALLALTTANAFFHYGHVVAGDVAWPSRLATGAYLMLIMIVSGRILPYSTGKWLQQRGSARLPAPYGRLDRVALVFALMALLAWTAQPRDLTTGLLCAAAAMLHGVRLFRWRGWAAAMEGAVLALHLAYAFVVLGLLALGAAAMDVLEASTAMHVATVGGIGTATFVVMTRATRGYTGLAFQATRMTNVGFAAIIVAGAIRPLVAVLPQFRSEVLALASAAWILAFCLFLLEYGSALATSQKKLPRARGSVWRA